MRNYNLFLNKFSSNAPLCIDLDGTLIKEDITFQSLKKLIQTSPITFFKTLFSILQGRAVFKEQLSKIVKINTNKLTLNKKLIKFIKQEKIKGRYIILVTAADQEQADMIQRNFISFDCIIASNGYSNRRAKEKAKNLILLFSKTGFIYAGNSNDDFHIWKLSLCKLCINTNTKLIQRINSLNKINFKFLN